MIENHIKNVKTLITRHQGDADRTAPGKPAANVKVYEHNAGWVLALQKLLEYLTEQERLSKPIPKSLGDLSDLPEELVKELSVKRVDELEGQILTVMRACDGEANLDQVLVGLFRKFKVVQTRRYIQNKLYRMSQKDLVFSIPGQRAAYSLEPHPQEAQKLESEPNDTKRVFERQELDDEIPF